jgi:diacylglycerol kinase family enzyme
MRIDAGLANGTFFLGSLITGLVPVMIEKLGRKKLPRLSMTWSKMAGRAADETMPQTATLKVDAYTFQIQPLIMHIQLLPNIMALPFAPVATPDDGRLVLIFDRDGTRDVVSHYIRDLRKRKYQYVDGIQMLRGERITITPASGRIWLIDGDKIEFAGEQIGIEILHRILRIFTDAAPKKE